MRVLVAADELGGLSGARAGAALARAWADEGAECAVVPLGDAGAGALRALADIRGLRPLSLPTVDALAPVAYVGDRELAVGLPAAPAAPGLPTASSAPLGEALREAVEATGAELGTIYLDLAWAASTHDGGAGLLAALGVSADVPLTQGWPALRGLTECDPAGARGVLGGARLVGLVPAGEEERLLLGLRGISAGRGYAADRPLEESTAADAALGAFAQAADERASGLPGAGACGGAGFAVLAAGGEVVSGPAACAEAAGLAATLPQADVVVAACDEFGFLTRGGGAVTHLAARCDETGVPLIVVSPRVQISLREMRTFGVEAAYPLAVAAPVDEAALTEAARTVARSWRW